MASSVADRAVARRVDTVARWVAAATAVVALVLLVLYNTTTSTVIDITQEDGPVEYAQAGLYVGCFLIFTAIVVRHRFRDLVAVLQMGFFFVAAGEEISWGQRIFGFESGSLGSSNLQGEFNVHNLDGIYQINRMGGILVIAAVVFLPVLARRATVGRLVQRWRVPLNPAWNAFVFAVGIAYMALPRLFGPGVIFELDEIGELFVAVGFFVYSYAAFEQSRMTPSR